MADSFSQLAHRMMYTSAHQLMTTHAREEGSGNTAFVYWLARIHPVVTEIPYCDDKLHVCCEA